MNARDEHQTEALGAYVLNTLDEQEAREVNEHVAQCTECRTELDELIAMRDMLGEVPPEAFLDGPPEGGDLLLQRTLRQVRGETKSASDKAAESSLRQMLEGPTDIPTSCRGVPNPDSFGAER